MEINPVFINELRQSPLRRKPALAIGFWLAITAMLMWLAQFAPAGSPFALVPLFALPMIVPAFAAGVFAKEYEQQTWQELYLTRLTNLQVVLGKFSAALMLSLATALSFLPVLLLIQEQNVIQEHKILTPGWWIVVLLWKVTLSTSLYVLLAMTCSRYSANRRTALVWSYIALSLYALMGYMVWQLVGQAVDRNTAILHYTNTGQAYSALPSLDDLVTPGFMGGIHLLFCSVVGAGTLVLLWVSLGEQRGYRIGAREESPRAWQPRKERVRLET